MFGRRPDATLVKDHGPMRRIMPYISPRRNESLFYLSQDVAVDAALDVLEKCNRERSPERPITLFHLVLRTLTQALELRPGMNRFVKGGKLWQRDGIYLTFSGKRALVDGAPMITVKRRFHPERESLDEMVDGIYDKLQPARAGVETTSDKETRWLLRLPGFAIRAVVRGGDLLDHFGLLPRAMIEPDPLYASVFVANLGSVGLEAGFHHVWERGTCSIFCVIGKVKTLPDGRRVATFCWTYDERLEDGLYAYFTLEGVKERLESPELLLATTGELAARTGAVRSSAVDDGDLPASVDRDTRTPAR